MILSPAAVPAGLDGRWHRRAEQTILAVTMSIDRTDSRAIGLAIRAATADDVEEMKHLLLTEGPNPWNHLPPAEVSRHVDAVATGEVHGVLAHDGYHLIGLATFRVGELSSLPLGDGFEPIHRDDLRPGTILGYIAEVVVHSACGGRGIGTRLLEEARGGLRALGAEVIYLKRHEENRASAAMMRRAGFREVAVFDDPAIRLTGSRRTSVSRFAFDDISVAGNDLRSDTARER